MIKNEMVEYRMTNIKINNIEKSMGKRNANYKYHVCPWK